MKRLLLATAALLALTTASNAATLQFLFSEDAGAITTTNFPSANATLSDVATPNFVIRNLSGTTVPDVFDPVLLSGTSIDVSGTGGGETNSHTLHLTINALGLTSPTGLSALLSSFDSSQLTSGWQVTATTDINNILLSTQLFIGTGSSDIASAFNLSNPFNASVHWDITNFGIVGGANVGTVLSAVGVPGPIVGAGLPGLLGMLGLGGFKFWRRRKLAA